MNALVKQCIATGFGFIVCAHLNGCLTTTFDGQLENSNTPPEYVALMTAQADVENCSVMSGAVRCVYQAKPLLISLSSSLELPPDLNLLQAIRDPLIVNLPAKAHNISGTFDNGQGFTGPLVITTGLASLPIDANTTLAAPAGTQFVIVDLPPNPPIGNYTFSFTFTAFPPVMYGAFAATVQVGGKTYYPLLLPCSTDVLNAWWHGDFGAPGGPPIPLFTPQNLAGLTTCNNKVYTFPTTTTPDLNQHGLTGSWYEATTSGQGVEVEVFANPASGMGSIFVSWFTYDTAMGGADHQRWYTAQGTVMTGQPNAALTIYQNTGGNFNAPPVTTAQPVGTATLSFDTCSSGQFSYSFTDGTGRMGNIPLTRLTDNVTCSTTTSYPINADFALSGNWYGGAATSGQGFTTEVNPVSGAFFSAWYTYAPMGAAAGAAGQRWYTAQGAFTPGMRSIPVTIYETTGGMFDKPTPPGQRTVPVGTGTMAFQNCTAATFSYNFTGGTSMGSSGTINLSRVGPVPPGCTS